MFRPVEKTKKRVAVVVVRDDGRSCLRFANFYFGVNSYNYIAMKSHGREMSINSLSHREVSRMRNFRFFFLSCSIFPQNEKTKMYMRKSYRITNYNFLRLETCS